MNNTPLARSEGVSHDAAKSVHRVTFERLAILYARVALGAAFLSAVADRFGLWGKRGGWRNFATFRAQNTKNSVHILTIIRAQRRDIGRVMREIPWNWINIWDVPVNADERIGCLKVCNVAR